MYYKICFYLPNTASNSNRAWLISSKIITSPEVDHTPHRWVHRLTLKEELLEGCARVREDQVLT